jgi:hypothetical protein
MEYDSGHNNPQYAVEERLARIEGKFVDISRNMVLFMEDLENKFGPFREVGGSNSEVGSDEKLRDCEDLEKELKNK